MQERCFKVHGTMVVGKIFPRAGGGRIADFFSGSQKDFFQGRGNSGEISFCQLETKRTTLLCLRLNRKI